MIPLERYMLNRRSHIIHRVPSSEACNKSHIKHSESIEPDTDMVSYLREHPEVRACRWCWKSED